MKTKEETQTAVQTLRQFIGHDQLLVTVQHAMRSEEKEWFRDILCRLAELVSTMPKTYDQDGKGDDAIVSLHYFMRGFNWYITERDSDQEQLQAFGLCDLAEPELGYVSLEEIISVGAELDYHFEPTTLREIKKAKYPHLLESETASA